MTDKADNDALIERLERLLPQMADPDWLRSEELPATASLVSMLPAILAALRTPQPEVDEAFQPRVQPFMMGCFGAEVSADMLERADRFTEEALELGQAIGHSAARAHALVDYVHGRPVGELSQEVGGVMVTLAALCLAAGLDMHESAETELARILQPQVMEKIRAKQAAKPTGSALPVATHPQPDVTETLRAEVARLREALGVADAAIKEMFRYYDGGETRGSYDGKPERNQLRKAGYATTAALKGTDYGRG